MHMHMYAHTCVKYSYTYACMHTHVCMHAQPMQTYILHPNMKIIKTKASYEKTATKNTSERGKFWLFILPKSYLNRHLFIHMHY